MKAKKRWIYQRYEWTQRPHVSVELYAWEHADGRDFILNYQLGGLKVLDPDLEQHRELCDVAEDWQAINLAIAAYERMAARAELYRQGMKPDDTEGIGDTDEPRRVAL